MTTSLCCSDSVMLCVLIQYFCYLPWLHSFSFFPQGLLGSLGFGTISPRTSLNFTTALPFTMESLVCNAPMHQAVSFHAFPSQQGFTQDQGDEGRRRESSVIFRTLYPASPYCSALSAGFPGCLCPGVPGHSAKCSGGGLTFHPAPEISLSSLCSNGWPGKTNQNSEGDSKKKRPLCREGSLSWSNTFFSYLEEQRKTMSLTDELEASSLCPILLVLKAWPRQCFTQEEWGLGE